MIGFRTLDDLHVLVVLVEEQHSESTPKDHMDY